MKKPANRTSKKSATAGRNAKTGKTIIGRERFAKISAVEGIVLTKSMTTRIQQFEKRGMSAAERRQTIIQAYRKG